MKKQVWVILGVARIMIFDVSVLLSNGSLLGTATKFVFITIFVVKVNELD